MALRRHVQGSRRLVQHDHARPRSERHGQDDPLLLAARQLMRVRLEQPGDFPEADLLESLLQPHLRVTEALGCRHLTVGLQYLFQLRPDPERRIERGRRVLGDVDHLGAAQVLELLLRRLHHVVVPDQYSPGRHLEAAADVAEEGQGDGGLSRARFPHQAEQFAGADLEGHVVDHVDRASGQDDAQALHVDPDVAGPGHGSSPATSAGGAPVSASRSIPMVTLATASVNVLAPMVSRAIRMAGTTTAHGLSTSPWRFSLIMMPQFGDGGGWPNPRNDNPAMMTME